MIAPSLGLFADGSGVMGGLGVSRTKCAKPRSRKRMKEQLPEIHQLSMSPFVGATQTYSM